MRHVTFREAADEALQKNWGQQKESANEMVKDGTWGFMTYVMAADCARSLRRIADILGCQNFMSMPHTLSRVEKNTRKKKKASK